MKLLTLALSLRTGSYNYKLVQIASRIAEAHGVQTEFLDLFNYVLPAFNPDVLQNQGFPLAADTFHKKLIAAEGLIIASPEYNFSYPGHFKNTYDWLSRYTPMPWAKKGVLLLSASPSLVGGNRGLWQLRIPFEACGAFVFPDMFSLASAHQAFNDKNELIDNMLMQRLTNTVNSFVDFMSGLKY